MTKMAVTLPTLESHSHIAGDIERGVELYQHGEASFEEYADHGYVADIPEKNGSGRVTLRFTKNGNDIDTFYCNKCVARGGGTICRHVVAAVLSIQGGIVETKLSLGKTASATTTVSKANTAKAVGSGSIDVFATPMMIALMERAACECLADAITEEQTSVGTQISVEHTAASPLGEEITASATIEYVFGRKVEFVVSASNSAGEIGKGRHTRIIIDKKRFAVKH